MNILIQILSDVLKPGTGFLRGLKTNNDENAHRCAKLAKSALSECKETLYDLGPWAAFKVAEYLIKDLGKVLF